MHDTGLPFSGKISFLTTAMYWPVNHMVSSKQETVSCNECHTRTGGRLANLTDFYLPGRDHSPVVERVGVWMLILTLLGVVSHGAIRMILAFTSGKRGDK